MLPRDVKLASLSSSWALPIVGHLGTKGPLQKISSNEDRRDQVQWEIVRRESNWHPLQHSRTTKGETDSPVERLDNILPGIVRGAFFKDE